MRRKSAGSKLPGGGGVILVDKTEGCTSHDVVLALRALLRLAAVGHTGTLDPAATGLLLACAGNATKLSPYLSGQDKEYVGTVTFGAVTDSLDASGTVIERRPVGGRVDEAKVRDAMKSLTGEIEQTPPMTSAVKVGGVRLHRLARRGVEVPRPARVVTVHSFDLTGCGPATADFRVVCSSGTYVRSLAADLGERLGCGGHLSRLRRVRVGRFSVDDALTVDEMASRGREATLAGALIPPARALDFLPYVALDAAGLDALRHGGRARAGSILQWSPGLTEAPGVIRVLDEGGALHAIGSATGLSKDGAPSGVKPVRVLQHSGSKSGG
jgi:tRNA pseudouridine55 synthase